VCPFQNCVDLNINCPGCETDIFTLLLLVWITEWSSEKILTRGSAHW
jgi:hypothetical protein